MGWGARLFRPLPRRYLERDCSTPQCFPPSALPTAGTSPRSPPRCLWCRGRIPGTGGTGTGRATAAAGLSVGPRTACARTPAGDTFPRYPRPPPSVSQPVFLAGER